MMWINTQKKISIWEKVEIRFAENINATFMAHLYKAQVKILSICNYCNSCWENFDTNLLRTDKQTHKDKTVSPPPISFERGYNYPYGTWTWLISGLYSTDINIIFFVNLKILLVLSPTCTKVIRLSFLLTASISSLLHGSVTKTTWFETNS